MGKIIGIDLGTTNSVVAIMDGGEPKVLVNEEGARTTPSVVAYTESGEVLVGQTARRQAVTNPTNTVFSAKRFIGNTFDECEREVGRVPYEAMKTSKGGVAFKVGGKEISPEEVSAQVLMKLKRAAEKYLGEEVSEAVITVPAYFNDSQREATKVAGKIAGLEVKRIVNEPTAAALAYGLDKESDEKIVVYDFGGGTFDVSILEVGENVVEVISTNGDTHLGGDDVDDAIMEYLFAEFKKDSGLDVRQDKMVVQRLKEAAEKAKIELSSAQSSEINLPFLTADASGPKHLNLKLSRAKLEQLIDAIVQRTLKPCEAALKDAKLKASDIDQVILVGGSTRIPMVQEAVKKFFGKEPNRSVNPDEVVAMGAAVQAGVLSGDVQDLLLLDVTPLSLGIETQGGVTTVLIPRNTTIPAKKTEIFSTAADSQSSVKVHVIQGERKMASDNRTLGDFNLEGIPPAPRGVPQIEVTFDIDANGIVHVGAKDKATGKEHQITITASSGLSDAEVERMVKDAEAHADEDQKRREKVEEHNKLDNLVYQTKKMLDEHGEKIDAENKAAVEAAIKTAEEKLDSDDLDEMRAAAEALTAASHKLAEAMYAATAKESETTNGATSPADDTAGSTDDDNVVDAEFEEAR